MKGNADARGNAASTVTRDHVTVPVNTGTRRRSGPAVAAKGGSKQPGRTPPSKTQGDVPNLYWEALSMRELRQSPLMTALPPTASLHLAGPRTYRYVRQDDKLWSDLHAGVLTTSKLKGALGFDCPEAAAVLGVGPGGVSVADVYLHLQQPLHVPPPADGASAAAPAARTRSPANDREETEEAGAVEANERLRQRHNATSARAALVSPSDRTGRQLHSKAVAQRGMTSVRLSWGMTQEASALACVAAIYPEAQLEEVGLYMSTNLHDGGLLPIGWGFSPGQLPAMGASPDAMLRHLLPITQADLHEGRRLLATALKAAASAGPTAGAAAGSPTTATGGRQGPLLAPQQRQGLGKGSGSAGGAAAATDPHALRAALSVARDLLLRKLDELPVPPSLAPFLALLPAAHAANSPAPPPQDVPLPSTGLLIAAAAAVAAVASVSLSAAAPVPVGGTRAVAQLVGRPAPVQDTVSLGTDNSGSVLWLAQQLVLQPLLPAVPQVRGASSGAAAAGVASPSDDGAATVLARLPWREVVEVKNHAPFFSSRRSPAGSLYCISDRGPQRSVRPVWVPQLQLEMLMTQCDTVLLASRSITQGTRVFRMRRDDAYLRAVLGCVRRLHTRHVLPRVPPPPGSDLYRPDTAGGALFGMLQPLQPLAVVGQDGKTVAPDGRRGGGEDAEGATVGDGGGGVGEGSVGYDLMLQRTVEIAVGAAVAWEQSALVGVTVVGGTDQHAFWDGVAA